MADTVTINLRHVSRDLDIPLKQVEAVVELLDEGNTVPFITRYRKDRTEGLDEEQVRQIQARLIKMRLLAERKQTILRSIESQGKLTEKLEKHILGAGTTKRLEDLYLPFKPKKQTLATTARSRGLELLASEILAAAVSSEQLDIRAKDFANPDKQVPTIADAVLGAGHILAEQFSENVELRQHLRDVLQRSGRIISARAGGDSRPAGAAEKGDPQSVAGFPASPAVEKAAPAVDPVVATAPEFQPLTVVAAAPELAAELPAVVSVEEPAAGGEVSAVGNCPVADDSPGLVPCAGESLEQPVSEESTSVQYMVSTSAMVVSEIVVVSQDPHVVHAIEPHGEDPAGLLPVQTTIGVQPQADVVAMGAGNAEAKVQAEKGKPRAPAQPSVKAKGKPTKADLKRQQKEQKKKKAEERKQKAFADYYDYAEEIKKIPPHRVLAINRGERARVLRVKLDCDIEAMYQVVEKLCVPPEHPHAAFLRGCARDALTRLILPSLEREVRRELTDRAEAHAVGVFAKNLRNLLLQPPVRDRRILAIDPGFKSGCKLVALDQFGTVLADDMVFLVGKPERREEAKKRIVEWVEKFQLTAIVIGNGSACRQTEDFIAELLGAELKDKGAGYMIVNEAGASVYSTSRLGREEFPHYDALLRGAISIGRRLQDPLSELVKIDPANIGVGLYQHDVKAKHLHESLDEVVESCVNYVGVDVNTASPALLRYVSGLNQLTARRLYEHRVQNGPFRTRQQLKEVPGFGEATFVQAAGFLKIVGGDNPLDASWIHPESYEIASRVMEKLGCSTGDLANRELAPTLAERIAKVDAAALAGELQVGVMLLKDIVAQLARPGRDPREDLPAPVFKHGAIKLEDLTPSMELSGTVLNVVDFGAFVDIGMHDSGLIHVSQLADKFVRDPHDVIAVGDVVRVWVLEVDKQRRRVSLTMIPPGHERAHPQRHGRPEGRGQPQRPAAGPEPQPRQGGPRPAGPFPPAGQRGQPSGQQGQRPGRPRFERRPPPSQGGQRSESRSGPPPQPKPRPKPVTPITDEMKTGKAPLRSFSDLLQFYDMQKPGSGGKKDEGRKGKDERNQNKDVAQKPNDQGQKPGSVEPKAADSAAEVQSRAAADTSPPSLEPVPPPVVPPPVVPPPVVPPQSAEGQPTVREDVATAPSVEPAGENPEAAPPQDEPPG